MFLAINTLLKIDAAALAPLGSKDARIGPGKKTGLPLSEIADILARDVSRGASGKGGYFISG